MRFLIPFPAIDLLLRNSHHQYSLDCAAGEHVHAHRPVADYGRLPALGLVLVQLREQDAPVFADRAR